MFTDRMPSTAVASVLSMTLAAAAFAGIAASCAKRQSPQAAPTDPARAVQQPTGASLEGTTWQLVRFQGGDDTTLTPDERAKYTIEFLAGGRLNARVDCNRGSSTWTFTGASQIEFGPLALTRAFCPDGSLHDHIVKQWGYVRSYVLKDGHLFLALMADGGIYEFEPVGSKPK